MMEMLKVPDHRWGCIATEILIEDRERTRSSNLSNSIDSEDESGDEDGPLTESELEEFTKNFRILHFDLVHKGHCQNVPELLDMLNVLLEADEISQADYMKTTCKIKDYL